MIEPAIDKEDSERRRYFRIDDDIIMNIRRLDQKSVDSELDRFDQNRESFCFMNTAELEKEQHLPALREIQENYPQIASYIGYLESRIDMLTKVFSNQHVEEDNTPSKVNISAQGIRFHSELIYDTDDFLEFRITLLPDHKRLLIIGAVIWCIEDTKVTTKDKHVTAVDFTYIHEADREVLVKHIHNKQLSKLRLENQAKNNT